MRRSETGSEVSEVSWDGLQGSFRAAFHVDVLKQRQEEAELSVHHSANSRDVEEQISEEGRGAFLTYLPLVALCVC